MNIEDLTPEERIKVQMHYLRVFFGRRRRRDFDDQKARIKRYDVAGRLIGIGDESCEPRMTSRQEDRTIIIV